MVKHLKSRGDLFYNSLPRYARNDEDQKKRHPEFSSGSFGKSILAFARMTCLDRDSDLPTHAQHVKNDEG